MTSIKKTQYVRLFVLALGLICLQAGAQEDSSPSADAPVVPADEFDRGTPLRSGDGFLAAVDEGDYEAAAEYRVVVFLRFSRSGELA